MQRLATLLTFALAVSAAAQSALPANTVRIHYQRSDTQYDAWGLHVWEDTSATVTWDKPLKIAGKDDFGVYWDVPLKPNPVKLGLIVHSGDKKDADKDLFMNLGLGHELWLKSGSANVAYTKAGPFTVDATQAVIAQAAPAPAPTAAAATIPAGNARINYYRPDGKYDGWGLHVWDGAKAPTEWTKPLAQTGKNDFGVYWDVPTVEGWTKLNFIIHKGDDKDPGPDQSLPASSGNQAWIISGSPAVNTARPDTSVRPVGDLSQQQAIWLTRDTLAVKPTLLANGALLNLYSSTAGDLKLTPAGVTGGENLPLVRSDAGDQLSAVLKTKYPYLANYAVVKLRPEDAGKVAAALRGQLAISSTGLDDKLIDATGVQLWGALDDLFGYTGPLGVTWAGSIPTLTVWAPTAQDVKVLVTVGGQTKTVAMKAGDKGSWSVTGDAGWKNAPYRYQVTVYAPTTGKVETNVVSDPYSIGLTADGQQSLVTDLSDTAQKPAGWDTLKKPLLNSVGDLNFYELHLRDFSVADVTVPAAERGTYLAFTQPNSDGMKHLKALADAGLKAVHLLPTFDIASLPKDKASWKSPGDLSKLPPASEEQQAAVSAVRDQDGFNWGYDPYHYMTPEGTYAVNPDQRTKEYRSMVMALNAAGLRVVQDVVFNHTAASGEADKSVLDKVVPGYYHRLDVNGVVANSTCCSNTATEHTMMRRLMIDTLVLEAKQYRVDGFRFDLMGHHLVSDMQAARAALDALTLAKDDVDGKQIYLYGEGWDFGEVAGNARGVNATQVNLYGQGIGTFNDRIRDAVRGGNPFGGLQDQGFATGLLTLPNGQPQNTDKAKLLKLTDQIKVALSGNLRDFKFVDNTGKTVTGAQVPYGDAPTGYAASPRETINYVSAHDNQTLWDAVLLKAPLSATTAERVRMQNLAYSLVLLGQGMPFIHAGDELLRSKSFDTDSYNSGDWFNEIAWTGADNGFGRGLPIAEKNKDQWNIYRPLLSNAALKVTAADRTRASDNLRELLSIRNSSPLFRLPTAQAVQNQLSFLNAGPAQTPGIIVMKLSGGTAPYKSVLVVFNASNAVYTLKDASLTPLKLDLHPVLKASSDAAVKQSTASGDTVSVPGLTTAVFVGK
ncbi:pullulanase-type alpha-1,6-glucosidase [Deinococcus detaillensis]|uniref:pullulanase n=1 Tax=Deinococcus detaillensis TaxID=2592048 RepID=A0A553UQD4_9DEIO|nr:pullulanase-type alpha-1,6-glucosidase [Deinococcus detaillensis]TSA82429.1 pullulanase-type alpha-1,6-glucosidase [Deinococcus detaillensis]